MVVEWHLLCSLIIPIYKKGFDPYALVGKCYTRETYGTLYGHLLQPINGLVEWNPTNEVVLDPPIPQVQEDQGS